LTTTGFGGALLMEPRTGKTQVALDYACIGFRQGKIKRVMIACPVSVMGVWEDEIAEVCAHTPYTITVWDKEGRKEEPQLPTDDRHLHFVLINYEAFQQPGAVMERAPDEVNDYGRVIKKGEVLKRSKSRGGRYDMKKAFRRWQPDLEILDESHRIKSPSARKTTMLWSLGKFAKYRIIMTGTAVTKKRRILDIYSQWKFLNPDGWVSEYTAKEFKAEFGVWRSMGRWDLFIRPQNQPKVRNLIHPDSYAIARDECYDLPASRNQIIHVDLDPDTARIYDDMAEELIAKVQSGEITTASIKLVQTLRFQQITSGITQVEPTPQYPEGRLVRIGREKLRMAEEILSDLFEADEKVVMAARFKADIAALVKVGKKLKVPVFELHGGIKRRDRDIAIAKFRKHEGAALFVMQPQAGALGIDLSTAATFIWFSLTNSMVDWIQCCDRIALSPRGTVIMYLLARGTYDEVMYQSLMEDQDVSRMIQESPDRLRRNFKKRLPKKRKK
jgi:SNF2 family DNA or RNA helicase